MIETRLFAVSDFERETMIKTYRLIKEHGYTATKEFRLRFLHFKIMHNTQIFFCEKFR